jgi:high affinity Mn2+ porin
MEPTLVFFWPRLLAVCCVAFALGSAAHAVEPRDVQTEVGELKKRVDRLEKRNAELEQTLESDRLSEQEPVLATRLQAVDEPAENMKPRASQLEALEGIDVEVSFTTVGQRANGAATIDGRRESQLNYRADVGVSLPVGAVGGESELFAQVRLGQGEGLARLRPTFSGPNATTFQLSGTSQADDSTALLAQLWYQARISTGDPASESYGEWQIGFGKADVFSFFDQNAIADNEAQQFLNTAFVHNPLLDAGGDVGADKYGFQPGVRWAYVNESRKPLTYGISVGVFGAGPAAHYQNTFSSPFSIVQLETRQRFLGGLGGNYRLYFWRNGRSTPFNNVLDSTVEQRAGWGLSVDQRVSEAVVLFARYGKETKGRVQFDRTITAGAEIGGEIWGRALDAVGAAAGILRTSAEFRVDAPTLDADGDMTPDFGYVPDVSEKVYEFYYRYHVSKEFALTPDFQLIRNPGGNGAADSMKIIGLRAQVTF